jgi:hypothetical protein
MTTDDPIDRLLAVRVLALLRESRLTHEAVANGIGISTRSLQRKLVGERSFSLPELRRPGRPDGSGVP